MIALKMMIMARNLTTKLGIQKKKRKLLKLVLTSHICYLSEHAFAIACSFGLHALWTELNSNIKQMAAEGRYCIITLPAECSERKQIKRKRRRKKSLAAKFQVPPWPTFAPKHNLTQAFPNTSNRVQICPEHMTPDEENHPALLKKNLFI